MNAFLPEQGSGKLQKALFTIPDHEINPLIVNIFTIIGNHLAHGPTLEEDLSQRRFGRFVRARSRRTQVYLDRRPIGNATRASRSGKFSFRQAGPAVDHGQPWCEVFAICHQGIVAASGGYLPSHNSFPVQSRSRETKKFCTVIGGKSRRTSPPDAIFWMVRIRCGALNWSIAAGFCAVNDFTSAWEGVANG